MHSDLGSLPYSQSIPAWGHAPPLAGGEGGHEIPPPVPEDALPEEAPDPPSPASTVYALPPQERTIAAAREISVARAGVLTANHRYMPQV